MNLFDEWWRMNLVLRYDRITAHLVEHSHPLIIKDEVKDKVIAMNGYDLQNTTV